MILSVAHNVDKQLASSQESLYKISLKYVKLIFSWELEVMEPALTIIAPITITHHIAA